MVAPRRLAQQRCDLHGGRTARALADAFTDLSNNTWVGSLSVADVDLMLAERRLQLTVTSGIRPSAAVGRDGLGVGDAASPAVRLQTSNVRSPTHCSRSAAHPLSSPTAGVSGNADIASEHGGGWRTTRVGSAPNIVRARSSDCSSWARGAGPDPEATFAMMISAPQSRR